MDNEPQESKPNDGTRDREMRKTVRIFVSSPGDVGAERVIADRVIRRLRREYRNSIDIRPILWENLPLMSTATFQDGIDALLKSAPIDVAIFILGARLGSPPGQNYIRRDGTPYGSGTEYEFDTMMEAYRRSGRPLILFYKKEVPERQILSGKGISEAETVIQQFKAVNQFVEEHFYDKDKGAYIAYHLLDDKSLGFEQRLESHLRELVEKLLPSQGTPRWSGNPYKGLLSFDIEDEAIFFGRSAVLNEIERELFARCSSERQELPCVIVSGESGAGKSSFVKAGLLPDLLRTTVYPKSKVEYRITSPGQWGGHSCVGLWQMLNEIFPSLPDLPQSSFSDPKFEDTITALLKEAVQKYTYETGLRPVPLIVVDQFEEVFTHADIVEQERINLAALLLALKKSNCILLILTIRSDFYQNLTGSREWLTLKKESVVCDLPRMTVAEYKQVITAPAELAGYKWERSARGGRRLDEVILDDTIKQQVSLPLLEFALADIVEHCGNEERLTFSAYKAIGGVEGAIQKRADELFKTLSSGEKEAFSRLLGFLVTISPMEGKYVRSVVAVKTVKSDEMMRKVMDVFVANRLFAISGNETKEPTVTIAHEALISQWKVIQDWIEREHQLIRAKRECEAAAEKWYSGNKDKLLLLTTRASLAMAEDLMICWPHGLSDSVREFINRSFKRVTRKFISIRIVGLVAAIFTELILLSIACGETLKPDAPMPSQIILALEFPIAICLLCYSLFQRFRGCLKSFRGTVDSIVYFTAFVILLFISGFAVRNIDLLFLNIGVSIPLIFRGGMSLFRRRRYVLRQKRIVSFSFHKPIWEILSDFFFTGLTYLFALGIMFSGYGLWQVAHLEKEALDETFVTMANEIGDGRFLDCCEHLVMEFSKRLEKNTAIAPSEAKALIKAKLAVGKAEEVLNDTNLLQSIDDSNEKANLMYRCHSAVGNVESAYQWANYDVMCDEYVKLFLALELGKTDDARSIFQRLLPPPLFPLSPQLVNYAHGMLLCSNSLSEAVAIYREIEGDSNLRNNLLSDFVLLKRQNEYRSRIAEIEKQLTSVPIPALEGAVLDIQKDMPWFVGTWRWEFGNGEYECDMVIDPAHKINCRYSLFSQGVVRSKVSSSCSIMRIQEEQDVHVYKIEEFNPQNGTISVGVWNLKDENTLEVTVLFNGSDVEKGQMRLYRRLSTNEIAVVREVYPNTPAASQGLQVGDVCCAFGDVECVADCNVLADIIPEMNDRKKSLVVARKNGAQIFDIKSFEFPSGEMGIRIVFESAYVADWEAVNKAWHEHGAKREEAR